MNLKKPPERLTNQEFITAMGLQIFEQFIVNPVALHWHEFYELTLVLAGQGEHRLNGRRYVLEPGTFFLLTPADFHQLEPMVGTTLELYNLIFSDQMLGEELFQLLFANDHEKVTQLSDPAFNRVRTGCERMVRELITLQPGYPLVIKSELTAMLVEFARHSSLERERPFQHDQAPYIRKSLAFLQHHFREELSLSQVARQVQLNPTYFSEYFSHATGATFQNYLQGLRLNFAAALLQMSQLSVTEICYASGFKTLTHFERTFKQKFGLSPKSYRKRPFSEDTLSSGEVSQSSST